MLSAACDNTIAVWTLDGGSPTNPITMQADGIEVTTAALHPRGTSVVTGAADGSITAWDVASRSPTRIGHKTHDSFVSSIQFSADGASLLTASQNGSLKRWSWPALDILTEYEGFSGWIRRAIFVPHHDEVIAAGQDPAVRVWRASDGTALREHRGPGSPIFSLACSPTGDRVFCVDANSGLYSWDRTGSDSILTRTLERPALHVLFSPDGNRVVTLGLGATANVFDTVPELKLEVVPLLKFEGAGASPLLSPQRQLEQWRSIAPR